MATLDDLSGYDFEDLMEDVFRNMGDVTVDAIDPVYLPHVRSRCRLGEYEYRFAYYSAGPSRVSTTDDFVSCVHCDDDVNRRTYCPNCGSINCPDHTRTERLEGTPVCTGCAVTERFALKTKYFYDEANLEAFRDEYASMPVHRKAMENPAGSAVALVFVVVLLVAIASGVGAF